MHTPELLEYETLSWVKNELDATLQHAKQALEVCIGEDADLAQLAQVKEALHQVSGTLQMVELYGAAMLAQEMEAVTQALVDDTVAARDDAFEVLLRAVMQLPDYLEHVQAGNRDVPIVLLPLLNDLRTARGASLLSERVLFFPDLATVEVPTGAASNTHEAEPEGDVRVLARRLRHRYQLALLGWFRDTDAPASLQRLKAVLDQLHDASQEAAAQRLWWTSGGLAEALALDALETSTTVKSLLGKVDREIKRLIDNGEAAFAPTIPEELFKNILYYVACADAKGERVIEVKSTYALEEILPQEDALDAVRTRIAGPNAHLLATVSSALQEDLAKIKDTLEVFVSADSRASADLAPLAGEMRTVADTLGMLGLGESRERVLAQATTVEHLAAGQVGGEEDGVLLTTAGVMLDVEQAISDYVSTRAASPESDRADTGDASVAPHERASPLRDRELLRSVAAGALEEMAKAKDTVSRFLVSPEDREPLRELPAQLDGLKGALQMAGVDEAVALLDALHRYVATRLLSEQVSPELEELESFADAITSVEYFLESLGSRVRQPEAILAVGFEAVAKLGYPTDQGALPSQASPVETLETDRLSEDDLQEIVDAANAGDVPGVDSDYREPTQVSPAVPSDHDNDLAEGSSEAAPPPQSDDPAEDEAAASRTPDDQGEAGSVERRLQPLAGDVDAELVEIFLEEAEEEVATIEKMLPQWRDQHDESALITIRRAFHTLKGSGRLVGAELIGELAGAHETLLNRVLDKSIAAADHIYDKIGQATATMHHLIEQVKHPQTSLEVDICAPIDEAHAMSSPGFDAESFQKKKTPLTSAAASTAAPSSVPTKA